MFNTTGMHLLKIKTEAIPRLQVSVLSVTITEANDMLCFF